MKPAKGTHWREWNFRLLVIKAKSHCYSPQNLLRFALINRLRGNLHRNDILTEIRYFVFWIIWVSDKRADLWTIWRELLKWSLLIAFVLTLLCGQKVLLYGPHIFNGLPFPSHKNIRIPHTQKLGELHFTPNIPIFWGTKFEKLS